MRRNKPRQHGVREARPAGGAVLGGRVRGAVVPAQVREEEGLHSPPVVFPGASSSPQELSSRPKLFYLPTDPPGSVSICCLGAPFFAVTACPRGKRNLGSPQGHGGGDARAVGGWGKHFAAFGETSECSEHCILRP